METPYFPAFDETRMKFSGYGELAKTKENQPGGRKTDYGKTDYLEINSLIIHDF